jgi:ABC transport system ATP-binding/permease protein
MPLTTPTSTLMLYYANDIPILTPQMTAKTVVLNSPFLQLDNQGETKTLQLTQDKHTLGRDPSLVDMLVPDSWQIVSRKQAVFKKDGEDYYIFDGDGQTASSNRLYLDRSLITPQTGCRLENGMVLNIGLDPKTLIRVTYINPNSSNSARINYSAQSTSLKQKSVTLGRDPSATLQLDAPTISRNHATINQDGSGRYIIRDLSTNGVFVNGQRISQPTIVNDGATIKIGPFTLVVRGDELQILDRGNQIRLDVDRVVLETKGKRRLDDLSFALEPGQFVALVGGSGAGKSTLMRTLLGTEAVTTGVVNINGSDLRRNFNIYRDQIGYVPQDDIIHMDLTVEEVLTYAAKLRLPPDTNIQEIVHKALVDTMMTVHQKKTIKQLSGGQRKRVSIGVELLANPKLFFLDEPTSGLDPGLDKQMMELLRDLAHNGQRTVVLVTHATANIVDCDRIVFLGADGKLCYLVPQPTRSNFLA